VYSLLLRVDRVKRSADALPSEIEALHPIRPGLQSRYGGFAAGISVYDAQIYVR